MIKKLPPLLDTTDEGRRVYEFRATIKGRKMEEVHIDPHYEEEHGSYMNDEKIYILVHELLRIQRFVFSGRKEKWEYFEADILWKEKNYRLVFCLEDDQEYLGIVTCYRKDK